MSQISRGEAHTHRVLVPDLDNLLVRAEDEALAGHPAATLDPRDVRDGQPVPLVLDRERTRRPNVVQQRVARRRPDRVRQAIRARGERRDRDHGPARAVVDARQSRGRDASGQQSANGQLEQAHPRSRPRVPELDRAVAFHAKRKKLVRRVDVDGVHAGHFFALALQEQRRHEASLVEV